MNKPISWCLSLLILMMLNGCGQPDWDWDPSDYFDAPEVIRLCNAIKKNRESEISEILSADIDVNLKGQGQMTPLAFALRYENILAFDELLRRGADPNVKLLADFGHPYARGSSVTHIAARAKFEYFKSVFDHGGDPNLKGTKQEESPLLNVIRFGAEQKLDRIKLLLDKGADVEYSGPLQKTPLQVAVTWGGQYDVAIALLEGGADPSRFVDGQYINAVHFALSEQRKRSSQWTTKQKSDHARLLQVISQRGCSVDEANSDLDRWASWGPLPPHLVKKKREEELQRLRDKLMKRDDPD